MIFQYATKSLKSDTRICFTIVAGFDGNAFKVCCGGGGPYNYNDTALCGNSEVIACDDPLKYVSWDGYHLTEAAHRWMTKALLEGPYTIPKFSFSCLSSE